MSVNVEQEEDRAESPVPSCLSVKSDRSKPDPPDFSNEPGPSDTQSMQEEEKGERKEALFGTLQRLGDQEFKEFKWRLEDITGFQAIPKSRLENADRLDTVDLMVQTHSTDASKVTRTVLVKINRKDLVKNVLPIRQRTEIIAECQKNLKSNLKERFQCVFEGIPNEDEEPTTPLNQIYTEIYITGAGTKEDNDKHEVRQIEAASRKPDRAETTIRQEDIFKCRPGRDKPVRAVLTKGVAGIGKTVLTQKFTLDWAEDKTNKDIQFIFPFTFRELNSLKEDNFSLTELVHQFFTETEEAGIYNFEEFQVVFILDGLDECRLPLDFSKTKILADVTKSVSLHVLLVNLIRGKLLPSARLWITTRPAAANQIPRKCFDMVTEVRGFNDQQKEEYVRKRFKDTEQASSIISHIKTSRSLFIMCHIPVFCWITATVLEKVLERGEGAELPKTLTAMFIHFLVVQAKLKNVKYHEGSGADQHWTEETIQMIESLGKLAFAQLQKPDGNLIFYESDLKECGIDITAASVYSGMFTQIFKVESGMYKNKVFCFIHLSVQEFLAALHVRLTFTNSGDNLMTEEQTTPHVSAETRLHQSAVDRALQSPNGQLDLFLRFLLGLSLETNQKLLRGLLTQRGSSSDTNKETVQYIKEKISEINEDESKKIREINEDESKKIREINEDESKKVSGNLSAERSINLFHCLNELNDSSLVEGIQWALRSGHLSTEKLSPAQWSALVFILLSSAEDLDVFDLKKYSASEEALLRLLPVVKASNKALLSSCNLSERSCAALSSVLSSSSLTELDLSNNNLQDSGVERLCVGLKSAGCKLENLSLSGCLVTAEGCESLVSALKSNPSHLRELDLSYNHPGASGEQLLSAGRDDPNWRLDTLRMDHSGAQWLKPGLRKYHCELTVDMNTVSTDLRLSDSNRKVTWVIEQQPYPDHPDRFDSDDCPQLLCREALPDRCYWEVEWSGGEVHIAVSYRRIRRKGSSNDCVFGENDQSWSLSCSDVAGYSVWHNKIITPLSSSRRPASHRAAVYVDRPASHRAAVYVDRPASHRVAVYVDRAAGSLSFYEVSSDRLKHLHTFSITFTGEPLYAGFRVYIGSSVSLCPL